MEEIFGVLASIRTSVKLKSTRRTRTLTIISMPKNFYANRLLQNQVKCAVYIFFQDINKK